MTTEQLDSLCLSISDDVRLNTLSSEITDHIVLVRAMENSFVSYLHNAYYTNGKKNCTATQKQVKEGILLRLAEGELSIEEIEDFHYKGKYVCPTEMVEKEYFFLNNQLAKISITIGRTDYNVLPRNYWIIVSQLDFIYYATKPEKKAIYYFFNPFPPIIHRKEYPTNVLTEDEWRQTILSYTNITEEQLKIDAYRLHMLYTLNKNLFNH